MFEKIKKQNELTGNMFSGLGPHRFYLINLQKLLLVIKGKSLLKPILPVLSIHLD